MDLNADFDQRASAHTSTMDWVTSPMPGVERKMLDRIGNEVARAATVVRYAPGSVFSSHIHTGGEEFLVLGGVFQDEHGDFPRGSYVRNPPESRHTPGSADGCTILVKLWQFDLNDRVDTKLRTHQLIYSPVRNHSGRSTAELHHDAREHVCMQQWQPGTQVLESFASGVELFVLGGVSPSKTKPSPQARGYAYPARAHYEPRSVATALTCG